MPPIPRPTVVVKAAPEVITREERLYSRGLERMEEFCRVNDLPVPPASTVPKADWHFDVCAYYRPPPEGIKICLPHCGVPAGHEMSRRWSWPGSTVDRTPYGVVCHELGHHADWFLSEEKMAYFGDYGLTLCGVSGDPSISTYGESNGWEWFAEMMRLFISNHALLMHLRPRTWEMLLDDWTPVSGDDWVGELGEGVPDRVVTALERKIGEVERKARKGMRRERGR